MYIYVYLTNLTSIYITFFSLKYTHHNNKFSNSLQPVMISISISENNKREDDQQMGNLPKASKFSILVNFSGI